MVDRVTGYLKTTCPQKTLGESYEQIFEPHYRISRTSYNCELSLRRVLMNRSLAITYRKQFVTGTLLPVRRMMIIGLAVFAVAVSVSAQNSDMQQKFATVKQSAAENQQKLHQYQWVETTELMLKGEAKPPKQSLCHYGPDGTVQKTPMAPPPEPPSGGRLKRHVVEKKTEEMQEYMGQVKSLLAMYVPPDPQKMQQAYQAGKFSLNPSGGAVNLVFTDYAQPGDRMTLTFNPAERKITGLHVNTYMGETKDTVTLQVQMASLPDATNYAQQTILDASAKKLQVTTTNSAYQKVGGH
jgi:hypothetical protein